MFSPKQSRWPLTFYAFLSKVDDYRSVWYASLKKISVCGNILGASCACKGNELNENIMPLLKVQLALLMI